MRQLPLMLCAVGRLEGGLLMEFEIFAMERKGFNLLHNRSQVVARVVEFFSDGFIPLLMGDGGREFIGHTRKVQPQQC